MRRWIRPYGARDDIVVGVAVAIALAAILLQLCRVLLSEPVSVADVAIAVAFDVVFLIAVWRILSVGLFINDRGIKVRTVLRTRVVAWTDIVLVHAGSASGYEACAMVLSVRGPRRSIETPIWRRATMVGAGSTSCARTSCSTSYGGRPAADPRRTMSAPN